MAEDSLVRKAATESGETGVIGDHRYYGRGRAPVERVRVGRAPDEQSGVQGQEERRDVQKLLNLLRESKNLLELDRRSEMLRYGIKRVGLVWEVRGDSDGDLTSSRPWNLCKRGLRMLRQCCAK